MGVGVALLSAVAGSGLLAPDSLGSSSGQPGGSANIAIMPGHLDSLVSASLNLMAPSEPSLRQVGRLP